MAEGLREESERRDQKSRRQEISESETNSEEQDNEGAGEEEMEQGEGRHWIGRRNHASIAVLTTIEDFLGREDG